MIKSIPLAFSAPHSWICSWSIYYVHILCVHTPCRRLHPAAIQRFMPKIIADISSLQPHSIMYMEVNIYTFASPDFHLTFTWYHTIVFMYETEDFMHYIFFCSATKFPLHPLCSLLWERPTVLWAGLGRREGVVCIGRLSPPWDPLQQAPTRKTGAKLCCLSSGRKLCHSPRYPPSLPVSAQHDVSIFGRRVRPPASQYLPGDHCEVGGEAICAQLCKLSPWLLGVWEGEWPCCMITYYRGSVWAGEWRVAT